MTKLATHVFMYKHQISILNKAPETKDMMIFNTDNEFAYTCTLMNVANFPIFNGHGPQTTKHSPEFVRAICGTCTCFNNTCITNFQNLCYFL